MMTITTTQQRITERLREPGLFREAAFIGGEWISATSGATIVVDDPATGALLGTVPDCGTAETEQAIAAANAAFPAWRAKTVEPVNAALIRS